MASFSATSTPSQSSVIPAVRYQDAHAAIDWLCRVLGFVRHAVYEGPNHTIAHAQLTFGSAGMIMLGSASNSGESAQHTVLPFEIDGRETVSLCLITDDAAPVYDRVVSAGAEILMELRAMDYGGRAFSVRDPGGHIWAIGEYDPWAETSS